ncbi:amidohydrolase family protein, partial [Vallitalea sediminicola]
MKIIDAHVHYSKIDSFINTACNTSKVDYSYNGYYDEFNKNGIEASIGMGIEESGEGNFPDSSCHNPMLLDLENKRPHNIYECIGINPTNLIGISKDEEFKRIEDYISNNTVIGIKLYAGYYHYHVYDNIYTPIYELALKHEL